MTPSRRSISPLARAARLVAFSAFFGFGIAHADDYSDITTLLKNGKPADALVKADQRLAANPRDPQLRFLRGVAQADSGKPNDAIASFTQLTQEYPELPEPYNNLAVLYAGQNQLDKARTALEMAIRTNPSYSTAHENLGDIYAKLAGQAYNKALQLDAKNSAALNPKLALIRNLFAPGQSTGVQTTTTTVAAATPARTPAAPIAAPAPAATPAPAPAPVVAAAPAAPPPKAVTATTAPVTPVASTPVVEPVKPAAVEPVKASGVDTVAEQDVEAAVKAWAAAWSARDMKAYLAAYGKQFDTPGKQSRAAWEKEREARIVSKSRIQVTVSNLSVKVNGDRATARFHQAYSADTLKVASRKTLELARIQGRWVIVRESTGG